MSETSWTWKWLGRVPFGATATMQERIRNEVLAGQTPETLLLCEHDPVLTLGRGARREHVLASAGELERRGITVASASRGGDVTYHGPGQLVGYPIFRLRRGIVAHFEAMAAGIVEVLGSLGIPSEWRRTTPGVWANGEKICAFGVHVRHRVAIHGFALNVAFDLDAFETIVPCGIRGAGVTSIARRLHPKAPPSLFEVATEVADAFARTFELPSLAK